MKSKPRFNSLTAAVALATITTLGASACSGHEAPTPKAATSSTPHKPSTAPEAQAEKAALGRINLYAVAASRAILKGLARPDVGAHAYTYPKDPERLGNVDHSGGTNKPETFVNYDPQTNLMELLSLSEIDRAGNSPTNEVTVELRVDDGSMLAIKDRRPPTVEDYQRTITPTNVEVVQAGADWGASNGYGIVERASSLHIIKGDGATEGIYGNGSAVSLTKAAENVSTERKLENAADNLHAAFEKVVPILAHEFTE